MRLPIFLMLLSLFLFLGPRGVQGTPSPWVEAVPIVRTTVLSQSHSANQESAPPTDRKKKRRTALLLLILGGLIIGAALVGLWLWLRYRLPLTTGCFLSVFLLWLGIVAMVLLFIFGAVFFGVGLVMGLRAGLFLSKEKRMALEAEEAAQAAAELEQLKERFPYFPPAYSRRYLALEAELAEYKAELPARLARLDLQYKGATYERAAHYRTKKAELNSRLDTLEQDLKQWEQWHQELATVAPEQRNTYLSLAQRAVALSETIQALEGSPYSGEQKRLASARAELQQIERDLAGLRHEH